MPDFQILEKLTSEAYLQLLDASFKSLAEKIQPAESFSQYKTICSNSGIAFLDLEPALKLLLQVSQDAVKKNKPLPLLRDELSNLGMSEEHLNVFFKQWEKVSPSLIHTTVDSIPINPLIDMEWKFGVTSASSQCNTVGNVFLQIQLEVDQGSGNSKTVSFELQLSEFYAFLHEMERARASLDYLS